VDEKDAQNFSPDFSGEKFCFGLKIWVFNLEKLQVFRTKNFTKMEMHFPFSYIWVDSNALLTRFRPLPPRNFLKKPPSEPPEGGFFLKFPEKNENLLVMLRFVAKVRCFQRKAL